MTTTEYKTRILIDTDYDSMMQSMDEIEFGISNATIEYDQDNVTYQAEHGAMISRGDYEDMEPEVFIVEKDVLSIRSYNEYSVSEVIYKYKKVEDIALTNPTKIINSWGDHHIVYNYKTNTYDYILSYVRNHSADEALELMNSTIEDLEEYFEY